MDGQITAKCCDRCGRPLAYLPNGMQSWASKDGQALHIECALPRRQVADPALSDETPGEGMGMAVSQEGDGS